MLGEALSEGSLCLEILGIFFPESDTLILPTNTCTRSQMPGVVGDGVCTGPLALCMQFRITLTTVPKSGVFTSPQLLSSVIPRLLS